MKTKFNLKKLLIIEGALLIFLALFYVCANAIAKYNGLAFRNNVENIYFWIFVSIMLIFTASVFIDLVKAAAKKTLKIQLRIIGGISAVLVFLLGGIIFVGSIFASAFSSQPEHVVEKDGKKMVACVDSFLQVQVNYYDYVNEIVRGNKLKIYEDYGNGGYDPFTLEKMPELKRSYNFN